MIEKIAVNGHYVWVDKDAEIKEGELVCGGLGGNDIKKYGKYFANDWYKIVAASPELNLEGVPTYVEWLAEQEYPKSNKKGYPLYMPTTVDLIMSRAAFIKGYQAAEKELYTEDDIHYFFECGRNFQLNGEVTYKQALDEFKQLKK